MAKSGEIITYTIQYQNKGVDSITTLVIKDGTPMFTSMVDANYGTLPANLLTCTIVKPSAGQVGLITWTFTGTLNPGSSGTVSFRVTVN